MSERDRFEKWYAQMMRRHGFSRTKEDIEGLREGAQYGDRQYLNGLWDGWKAHKRCTR